MWVAHFGVIINPSHPVPPLTHPFPPLISSHVLSSSFSSFHPHTRPTDMHQTRQINAKAEHFDLFLLSCPLLLLLSSPLLSSHVFSFPLLSPSLLSFPPPPLLFVTGHSTLNQQTRTRQDKSMLKPNIFLTLHLQLCDFVL